ncbi:MAG: shikimate dehydrogenase [Comamonadaceae bacterium]|nr:MAG: shikimate dehydrogenase [Comamonadaceae bacterium]
MDRYCVIGNPVAHSRSPWIHARFAELTGQALHYDRLLVEPGGFAQAVAALRAAGARGCNVTVPFKFEAAGLATQTTARGRLAGACNTLRFDGDAVCADNTDGVGLVRDIERNAGVGLHSADVLLIGAGGAAAGVLGPLLQALPRRIVLANRTAGRATALAQRHAALAAQHGVELTGVALDAVAGDFGVVVNATAASLAGSSVPVAASVLRPGALACDMMYGPAAREFIDWAARHGAIPRDGLGMLVEQAAEAFLFWRGVRPPSATVLAELRALVP